jgi:hypothetical protein
VKTGVSYFSSRDLRHVRLDMAELAGMRCSYVVHCYTETDLAYYRKTMSDIATATHEAGMEVWFDPWGVAGIFSGETLTRFPLDHPDTHQLLSDGKRVGHSCPNHPETRAFLKGWIDAAAEAGTDVLFWDEPHFYAGLFVRDFRPVWACYCDHCAKRFRERTGSALPREFTPQLRMFREESLLGLLAELCRHGKSHGLRNALCPVPVDLAKHGFPRSAERLRELVQASAGDAAESTVDALLHIGIGDFDSCAAIPDLDIFGTDPYWYLFGVAAEDFMRAYGRAAAAACRKYGRELQLWLQAFRVPAGREEELRAGVRVAEEFGADYLAAWSFRATESMSEIACADPEAVWSVLGEEFRRISS